MRSVAADASYRAGAFRPVANPLAGISAAEIENLQSVGLARDALNVQRAETLVGTEGLCREVGGDLWFTVGKSYVKGYRDIAAIEICESCAVKRSCLLLALKSEEPHGIWGGMTAGGRKKLSIRIRAAMAVPVAESEKSIEDAASGCAKEGVPHV